MTEQQSRYYDWTEGRNRVWLTGVKHERDTKRDYIKLFFAAQPSAENADAPFTQMRLYLPKSDDQAFTRASFDRRLKMVLFSVTETPPDAKVKLSEIFRKAKTTLDQADIACDVDIKLTEGTSVDPNTGEARKFAEIVGFAAVDAMAKKPYESSIEIDDLDDTPAFS
jgi:hypothetical protein